MIYINGRFLTQRITGVQRFALEITRVLISIDPCIRIVVPENGREEVLSTYGNELAKFFLFYGSGNALIWEQIMLPFFCFKNRCTLLNFCNSAPIFYFRKLVCVHDMSYKVGKEWFSLKMRAYYSALIPLILRTAKYRITVSEFSKSQILYYLPFLKKDDVKVIYNAPSSLFSYDYLPTNNRKRQILFVGSLEPRKNLTRLIEAFIQVEDPTIGLVVVGNINRKIFNEEIVFSNTHSIEWKTDCSDEELQQLYLESFVYINTSLYEGFGLPVIEAANSGCLLLLSDIAIFKEVSKGNALFFDPENVNSITGAINRVFSITDTEKQQIIESGFQSARMFSWKKSAQQIYMLIS